MREIKFRGKNEKTGNWEFGCLVNNMWTHSEYSKFEKGSKVSEIITGHYESDNWQEAIEEDSNVVKVLTDSVGQFTGLKDKNGTDIYEGDLISMTTKKTVAVIDYDYCGFVLKWIDKTYLQVRQFEKEPIFRNIHLFEVVGNIHDTPIQNN